MIGAWEAGIGRGAAEPARVTMRRRRAARWIETGQD